MGGASAAGRPRGQNVQAGDGRGLDHFILPDQAIHQRGRQACVRRQAQLGVHSGPAQVAIDQQGLVFLLRVGNRQVDGDGGLALGRRGAGQHQALQRAVEGAEQDGVAQGADGFLISGGGPQRGLSDFSHGRALTRSIEVGRHQFASPRLHHGQASHDLGSQQDAGLFRVADGVVEHIAHHGGAHGEQGGKVQRQHEVEPRVRIDGVQAGQGVVGDADGAFRRRGFEGRTAGAGDGHTDGERVVLGDGVGGGRLPPL
jgi:hypothetical protein